MKSHLDATTTTTTTRPRHTESLRRARSIAGLVAGALALASCAPMDGGGGDPMSGDPGAENVVGGHASFGHPEIGQFEFTLPGGGRATCTATLITSFAAITASHCINFESVDVSDRGWVFRVQTAQDSDPVEYAVAETFSLRGPITDNDPKPDDIGLIRLADRVDTTQVTPACVGATPPSAGARLTAWGFGCDTRAGNLHAGVKRYVAFTYGSNSRITCSGDSGGPVFDANGRLVLTISGAYDHPPPGLPVGTDGFAVPSNDANRFALGAQLAAWNGGSFQFCSGL